MHASSEQLIALRDGEPVDAALQAHVRACAECAAAFNTLVELRDQITRLPPFALPEDAWQKVADRIAHAEQTSGFWRHGLRMVGAAMVASVAIAVLLVQFPTGQHSTPVTAAGNNDASVTVPQLVTESRYLENAVSSLNANTDHLVMSTGTAATVAALEDRIALVDYAINHASVDPQARGDLPHLWQQRVNLLQSLAAVRYAQLAGSNI